MSISIFAKQAFLNVNPSQTYIHNGEKPKRGHLMRVSSMIRGDQIADRIGARYNPTEGYQDDVCIYVKPHLKKNNMDFHFEGKKAYIDIVDGHNLGHLMKRYPEVGVIVCSKADYDTMKAELTNEIVLIPQHHCNFDRIVREREGITRIGMIGEENAFEWLPAGLERELKERGIELVKFSKFFTRADIIDFYMGIDIQIVWRPYKKVLSNPLKIVNASSFGIPTVALDEKAFWEMKGCYIPVDNMESLLFAIDRLKEPWLYWTYSTACLAKSEEYHIDNIGELYKNLDK